jgi:hypothetical protein
LLSCLRFIWSVAYITSACNEYLCALYAGFITSPYLMVSSADEQYDAS